MSSRTRPPRPDATTAASGATGQLSDVVVAATLAARLLAEEAGALFYVAATRARRLLVVTASGGDEQDKRPSRFLAELAGDNVEIERAGAATRWLALPALVADLAGRSPTRDDRLRYAGGRPPARQARGGGRARRDPRDWYALTELSDATPVVEAGERVRLSPSHVETFTRCGLRWLLESAVGAGRPDVLRHLGTVIHAAAQLIAEGETESAVADRIDDIWHHLDFGSSGTAAGSGSWPSAWSASSSTGTRPTPGSCSRPSRRCGSGWAGWRSPAGWTGSSGTGRAVA